MTQQKLYELLTSSDSLELKQKVGIIGPYDGSAKVTTRLLVSKNWIIKTDLAQTRDNLGEIQAEIKKNIDLSNQIPIWHPLKEWFILKTPGRLWPCSVCPFLNTLRNLPGWNEKVKWWIKMISISAKATLRHGISLDINPSNFAIDYQNNMLYYVDDEVYRSSNLLDIADALAQRIPEEKDISPKKWFELGHLVQKELLSSPIELAQLYEISHRVSEYPLSSQFAPCREQLLQGLCKK